MPQNFENNNVGEMSTCPKMVVTAQSSDEGSSASNSQTLSVKQKGDDVCLQCCFWSTAVNLLLIPLCGVIIARALFLLSMWCVSEPAQL